MKASPLKPVLGNIVIRPVVAAKESSGGIALMNAQTGNRGTVIAIGPGDIHEKTGLRMPVDVELGDVVIYNEHVQACEIEGETLYIAQQHLIHAIIVPKA